MDASASAEPTDLTVEVAPGVELAVTRRGHGPTVLLVGGLGMPQLIWEMCGLTASLVEAGFEVVTYNARGLAPSSAPPPPYSVPELADDAAAILDRLGRGSAIVVGYSMGCYVTQTLIRRRPELVDAAVLFAGLQPTPVGALVGKMELDLIERLGEIPKDVLVFEQLVTSLHPELLQDPAAVAGWRDLLGAGDATWTHPDGFVGQLTASQEWITAGEPLPEHLAEIKVPTLVMAFEYDLFFPPKVCAETAKHIPDSRFLQVDGVGHGGLFTGPGNSAAHITTFCLEHVHR